MPNVAILIDAENVLPTYAEQIFARAAAAGEIKVREIYGTAAALTTWTEPVLKYALHANLTIKASKMKNTSDIALAIGAMDLMISGNIQTVVLVSSDSDFSALSVRLRSSGVEVIGMGTERSNALWRTSCSSFAVLQSSPQGTQTKSQPAKQPASQPSPKQTAAPVSQPHPTAPSQPQAAQPRPAAPVKSVPAHPERIGIIRAFIRKQLEENGGQVTLNSLMQALNTLPEYRVDQRGSKRKPLNYLVSMFNDVFNFDDRASGATMITFRAASMQKEPPVSSPVPEAEKKAEESAATPSSPTVLADQESSGAPSPESEETQEMKTATESPSNPGKDAVETTEFHSGKKESASSHKGKASKKDSALNKKKEISLYDAGIQPRPLSSLIAAGYQTLNEVAALSDEKLVAIRYVGTATIDQIRKAAKDAGI